MQPYQPLKLDATILGGKGPELDGLAQSLVATLVVQVTLFAIARFAARANGAHLLDAGPAATIIIHVSINARPMRAERVGNVVSDRHAGAQQQEDALRKAREHCCTWPGVAIRQHKVPPTFRHPSCCSMCHTHIALSPRRVTNGIPLP